MPNTANILAPFTIVGNGRSGTSLVSRALGRHSQCMFAGETVNLIHSVWKSLETNLPVKKQVEIPDVIRQQFLRLFPSRQRTWMHKPIGIPIVWNLFPDEETFIVWFWDVLERVFPDAKYFTVLRHPLDTAVSSHQWWGWSYASILNSNRLIAKIINHPRSRVTFAVDFHQLSADPKIHTMRLLDFLGLPFEPECLTAFETVHVGNSKKSPPRSRSARLISPYDYVDQWKDIDPSLLSEDYRNSVQACWEKFGLDFGGWPNPVEAKSN
jgi:Sulfotransferase family